jgi:hypothetical protein
METEALDRTVGKLLLVGSWMAVICLGLGLVILLAGGSIAQGDPGKVFLTAGLVLMMATHVGRVLAALMAFLRQRDWRYAAVAAGVLGTLILGFLIGLVTQ